jgi:hypothetical protein
VTKTEKSQVTTDLPHRLPVPNDHDLHMFVSQVQNDISDEYDRIFRRATEDPGTAGDEAEETWARILRQWLPPAYRVVTKGRIIGATGTSSGQIDILILSPSYPPFLVDRKQYLAPGVVAAFECKLTLKRRDIFTAVEKGAHLKRMLRVEFETYPPPICGILAHSHSWRSPKRREIAERISRTLREAEAQHASTPLEVLDSLCLASLGTWSLLRSASFSDPNRISTCAMGPSFHPETDSYQSTDRPFGRFLTYLLRRLSQRAGNELHALADYMRTVGLENIGVGQIREWPEGAALPTTANEMVI